MSNRLSKRSDIDYSKVLVAMFELMLMSGVRAKDLVPLCIRALQHAETRIRRSRRDEYDGLRTAALVLDAWHRDRRYLSARGTPKPVRLIGPTPSVEALIRRQKVKERGPDVARRLKAIRFILPCGRSLYKPASDIALIPTRSPLVLQHAVRVLLALLETVGQNVRGTPKLAPLIERCAEVPDLPGKYARDFQLFTQAQGRAFVRTVNDWLESRRARRSTAAGVDATVRAGIHTFAYIAPKRDRKLSPN
jgi:hypothetical protein